tara:strand:- start:31274 stop:33226 length:1953 start_codon:yes stop_codon:yes gene_type:complete
MTPIRTAGVGLLLSFALAGTAVAQSENQDGYLSNNALFDSAKALDASSTHAWLSTIGSSLAGQPIHLITLGSSKGTASDHPAMLITAGIDGRQLASTETAMRIANRIIESHTDLLDEMTIYIVPRLNPDGAARNLKSLSMGDAGNTRPVDDDRDRLLNEDAPEDLNNDGYITTMRRLNPPIDDIPTHLADPDDPRLNIEPDLKEDQHASFTIYPEGIDNDGDGQINEDGFGSVDLDQNFMHRWPEHATHAGRYPLSEPEAHAIAQFVLENDHIVMALTLGRHDNLVNLPQSGAKDISGAAPKEIDSKDSDLYKQASELFKEAVGYKEAPKHDTAGSFHAWLYAQRGIPSFAANAWARPELESADDNDQDQEPAETPAAEAPNAEPRLTPSGVGDISMETLEELMDAYEAFTGEPVDQTMMGMITPDMVEQYAAQAGIQIRRVTPEAEPKADKPKSDDKPKKKKLSDDAKWLAYFEQAGITGFVDWQPYDHPTLGKVEIGGFVPLAKINPPSSELDPIADKMTAFVVDLIDARPQLSIVGPEIKQLADGLYEVRVSIVNEGAMPTTTAYSQSKRTIRPIVLRLSTPVDQIIQGQRVSRIWGIAPDGGRSDHHWIFRTSSDEDITDITIEINDPRLGNHSIKLSQPSAEDQS